MNFKLILKPIFLILFLALFTSCSYFKKDNSAEGKVDEKPKKKIVSANIDEKIESGSGTLFGGSKDKDNNFQFTTSNALWRASLDVLEDLPLSEVDYSGGMIVTDWYSPRLSKESVKISVQFASSEVKASSISIKSFKRVCENNSKCETKPLGSNFNNKIKENILKVAREIKIKDNLKKK